MIFAGVGSSLDGLGPRWGSIVQGQSPNEFFTRMQQSFGAYKF